MYQDWLILYSSWRYCNDASRDGGSFNESNLRQNARLAEKREKKKRNELADRPKIQEVQRARKIKQQCNCGDEYSQSEHHGR